MNPQAPQAPTDHHHHRQKIIPTIHNLQMDFRRRLRQAATLNKKKKTAKKNQTKKKTKHQVLPLPEERAVSEETPPLSVLIVGAAGRLGTAVAREFAKQHDDNVQLHAFVPNPDKIAAVDRPLYASIFRGDARVPMYLHQALQISRATLVIVAIGNTSNNNNNNNTHNSHPSEGNSNSSTPLTDRNVRTASAHALAKVLRQPMHKHVRCLVVSSVGAGDALAQHSVLSTHPTKRRRRRSIAGKLDTTQFVLNDHAGQERALLSSSSSSRLCQRVTIVRPTALVGGGGGAATASHHFHHHKTAPPPSIATFGDDQTPPSWTTDRGALAAWIVQLTTDDKINHKYQGRAVNVTGARTASDAVATLTTHG